MVEWVDFWGFTKEIFVQILNHITISFMIDGLKSNNHVVCVCTALPCKIWYVFWLISKTYEVTIPR